MTQDGSTQRPEPGPLHPAMLPPERLLAECDQTFTRRSGPGGQNRNKVETAVVLRHRPTGLTSEANEQRTQGANREAALFRLRLRLALEVRSSGAGPAVRSARWRSRCQSGRVVVSPSHDDFPALLAEALDVLQRHADDVPAAASVLGITGTQLVKLLKEEPRALTRLNAARAERGQHPLR